MRRLVALILAALAFVQPSAALTPAQELVLFGGGTTYYANPAVTGVVPSWLSYASAGVRYYFDAAGNLQTAPNNLILNSAVFSTQTVAVTSGTSYILSATMASGSSIAATGAATATLNGSGGGTRVFVSFTASSASVTLTLTGAAAQSQIEQVTAAQTTPRPFMPTTGSAYYSPVVNDHNPSTLAALGLRSEPQRTNLFLNNLAPVTQTITVVSGTVYTVSFFGTGSIVLSGAATQTMTGSAGARSQYSFTASSTALVVTVSGLAATSYPQVEANAFATSPILTYGTAVTVPADNWSFTGAALAQLKTGKFCVALSMTVEGNLNGYPTFFTVSDGTINNREFLLFGPSLYPYIASNPANTTAINYSSVTVGVPFNIAANFGATTMMYTFQGRPVQSAANSVPPGLNQANLGGQSFGWFSQIMIRPSCTAQQVQRYSTAGANLRGN